MSKVEEEKYPIYEELIEAYDFYNKELFGGVLPRCIVILSKNVNSYGHFMPQNYMSVKNEEEKKHEIAMNVEMFQVRDIELTLSTLVHEMCHLKTFEEGTYGRGGYHRKEWAYIMNKIGLIPSTTGKPGGSQTGQSVSHYIEKGGLFEIKTKELLKKGYIIPFVQRIQKEVKSYGLEELEKRRVKGKPGVFLDENNEEFEGKMIISGKDEKGEDIVKVLVKRKNERAIYVCSCGHRLWGKSGLKITCNECNNNFNECS